MKILMATMGLDIGGAETHIVELSKELTHQGHQVVIVSNGGVYVPEVEAAGIRHYEAPLNRRSFSSMRQAQAVLRRVIQAEKPDVVHAHARIPAFLCGSLQRSMGFPFVTTAHWVFDTKGMLRYLTNWGDRTVAVSDDIKAYLIREYGLKAENISVTINGIDTDKFSPEISGQAVLEEFSMDPEKPVVSYVSRMDADRAMVARQLIEVAPQLDRLVPGVQLLIAGGGNVFQELKEKADKVNADLGRKCVVMTGPRTDINRIVAAGQVFVGVSRAALEAMTEGWGNPSSRYALGREIYQAVTFLSREQEHLLLDRAPHLKTTRWHPNFLDVIPPIGGKDLGMDAILDHFGIPVENCMAFGDGENDLSMLVHAGIGVAMGTASDAVKAQADYAAPSVDEDGIAHTLSHFGLIP